MGCLEAYASVPELRKCVLLLMAHGASSTDPVLEELCKIFTHFDTMNRGTLNCDDVRRMLLEANMSPIKADAIVHSLDRDDSGDIQWTEFIAAALCIKMSTQNNFIDAAFSKFDRDGDGFINVDDILQTFADQRSRGRWTKLIRDEFGQMTLSDRCSKDEFHKFMTVRMRTTRGSDLVAVS